MTKKAISTALNQANLARVNGILIGIPERLARLGESLSDDQARQPLGKGERSLVESLAHLVNSEARTSEAIYLALLVEQPLLATVHSERQYGRLLQFELFPYNELLVYFRLRRHALLRVLSGLDLAQWQRTVQEAGKQRRESVYWKARALALHEEEHLSDLEAKLDHR